MCDIGTEFPSHKHLMNQLYWSTAELYNKLAAIIPDRYSDVALADLPAQQKWTVYVQRGLSDVDIQIHEFRPNGRYEGNRVKRYFQSSFESRLHYAYVDMAAVISRYKQKKRAIVCPSIILKKNRETKAYEDTGHRLWRIWYTRCNDPAVWGLIWVHQTQKFQLCKKVMHELRYRITVNYMPYDTDPIFRYVFAFYEC